MDTWTASSLVIAKLPVGHSFKGCRSIATVRVVPLRSRSITQSRIFLMTPDAFSFAEATVQAIQGLQVAYYSGVATLVMFLWDYGEPTNHMFDTSSGFDSLSSVQ